jgi:2-C-methyl-D-erythritol 4-phosphate cytidylyltransferase
MKITAVIVAGGSGTRMKQDIPKQFIRIGRLPLLMHTISVFHDFDPQMDMIVALPEAFIGYWTGLCEEYQYKVQHKVVAGGRTRFDTVKNSLAVVSPEGLVAIHDGVRPLVSHATLERCFTTAAEKGSAIPCISAAESLRVQNDTGNYPVDRTHYRLIQTPQVFNAGLLKQAYACDYLPEFTDDAGVFEKAGYAVTLVEGNTENIKITNPSDLVIAEAFLGNK